MEAIVLAGGFGTRLRSVVPDLPKPMAPVGGKPFLELLLQYYASQRFERILLSVHFMAEVIEAYFGDRYLGMELVYVRDAVPLGTGGAVRKAMAESREDFVFVFNGDTLIDIDTQRMLGLWSVERAPVLVGRMVDDVSRYGALTVEDGKVVAFREKQFSGRGLINAGCYLLPTNLLNEFAVGHAFSFESDFLKPRITEISCSFFQAHGRFIDIGIPEDYVKAQSLVIN